MELILLERVENLGQMGDIVKVRPGYARNFLLPMKKALRANNANKRIFDAQRAELEARNLERKHEAEAAATKIDGQSFVVIRQASETGVLYGSVSTRDIASTASNAGIAIERGQIRLDKPLKTIGISKVRIVLHPEVHVTIEVNVARSEDEAERQARGEDVLAREVDVVDTDDTTAEFFDAETGEATVSADESASSDDENLA
ncbi:MAG: 50S ribosomal protein L9 [Alphaproteobacteria bacterium]|nr:50S ribosomal protein L9 [Alphaproteobacteria bacterium]